MTTKVSTTIATEAIRTVVTRATMHQACISFWGQSPQYQELAAPESPGRNSSRVQIRVTAAAVHNLVRLRVAGKHYSAKSLPHIPGVDGVGLTPDGEEVYFSTLDENMGSYAEVVNVLKRNTFPLPRGVDGLQVAALVNPVMSSWMALRKRAVTLPDQFSVLILGATSLSGTLAISVARALGAGKVIGVARNQNKLDNLPLDQTICLQDPATETDFSSLGHVDIILDYVYGSPAAHLLTSLEPSSRLVQYFQIGDLASPHILLPSKAIRSTRLLMCGSGIGSWSFDELRDELPEMVRAVAALPHQNLNVVPLRQIETAWKQVSLDRTVFIP